jgi:SAM-dependent methyltransferase
MKAELDPAKKEAFAGRLLEVLNGGGLALMASLGHQTGLFDVMAKLPPSSSAAIADVAGLNERYVREWLAAMSTGGIVEHDPVEGTYRLPPEHAASLTRGARTGNLAGLMQWIGCMASVERGIVESFRKGGGVDYEQFARFHEIMAEENGTVFEDTLVQTTLPLVEGLTERLGDGADVLDVGCGSGHAINLMAKAYPKSRFVGYEFSEEAIARGRAEAEAWGLANARFEFNDAAKIADVERFDLITTFDAVHDQARPDEVLRRIANALKNDGIYLMVDVRASSKLHENLEHPLAPFLYSISTMHCMTVSLAQKGAGLGTMWGEQKALEMLSEAGFSDVSVRNVEGDILNSYYIARKA